MVASDRVLTLKITGDAFGLGRAFGAVDRGASRMERGMDRTRRGLVGLGKAAAVSAAAVAAAGAAFAKVGLSEALDQEKVAARTANVIESMGNRANVSASQVADLAGRLQDTTGSADDVVQAGANLVLTFGNIRNAAGKGNDVFDQTVALANDMSVALGTGMEQASLQLGKALNDPARGLTQLRRVGVSFTEAQQAQVKALVASGDTMGAQKVILGELEKQFGGAAAAEGPLTEGTQALQRTFENVSESVMVRAIPALTTAVDLIRGHVVPVIQDVAERVAPLVGDAIGWIGERAAELAEYLRGRWGEIRAGVLAVWQQIVDTVVPVVERLTAAVVENWDRIRLMAEGVFREVVATVRSALAALRPVLESLAALVRSALELVLAIWEQWGATLFAVVRRVFTEVARVARPLLDTIRSVIETVTALIEGDWSGVWAGLKGIAVNALKAAAAAVQAVARLLLGAFRWVLRKALDGLLAAPRAMFDAGRKIVEKIVDGIKAAPGAIKDAIRDMVPTPGDVIGWFTGNSSSVRVGTPGAVNLGRFARARGGMLPGRYGGRDTMLIAAAPGEAVLTPRQQALVDSGVPIASAFRATGAFAAGGYVQDAYGRATAQLGKPYGKPSLGQSRTGPGSWDCSGFATYVAGVNVGGTHGVGVSDVESAAWRGADRMGLPQEPQRSIPRRV